MVKARLKDLTIEEFANTITHGFGLLLSVVGFIFLVVLASVKGDFWYVLSSVLYGLSLVTLYAASSTSLATASPTRRSKTDGIM